MNWSLPMRLGEGATTNSLAPPSFWKAMDGLSAQGYRWAVSSNNERANREINRWSGGIGRTARGIESPALRQVNQRVSGGSTQRRHCQQWLRLLKQLEV